MREVDLDASGIFCCVMSEAISMKIFGLALRNITIVLSNWTPFSNSFCLDISCRLNLTLTLSTIKMIIDEHW